MIGEPRTIARILELLHLPMQHSPEVLRDIYLAISTSCGYDNFIRMAGGARLETAGEGGAVSRVTFAGDRISFHEEHNNLGMEGFSRRVQEVARVVTEKLSIPLFICRNITLRAVASSPGSAGPQASRFLAENLLRVSPEEFAPFERPGQIVGFRMHFPPRDPRGGMHQIRIESYLRDPRSLFLEDWATFKAPVQSRDTAKISEELLEVEDFLHERMAAFLNQFPRS